MTSQTTSTPRLVLSAAIAYLAAAATHSAVLALWQAIVDPYAAPTELALPAELLGLRPLLIAGTLTIASMLLITDRARAWLAAHPRGDRDSARRPNARLSRTLLLGFFVGEMVYATAWATAVQFAPGLGATSMRLHGLVLWPFGSMQLLMRSLISVSSWESFDFAIPVLLSAPWVFIMLSSTMIVSQVTQLDLTRRRRFLTMAGWLVLLMAALWGWMIGAGHLLDRRGLASPLVLLVLLFAPFLLVLHGLLLWQWRRAHRPHIGEGGPSVPPPTAAVTT